MKGKKKRKSDGGIVNSRKFVLSALISQIITFAIITVLAFICYKLENPIEYVRITSFIALALSAIFTGIVSAKMQGRAHLLSGALGGFIAVIIMFVLSLLWKESGEIGALSSLGIYALYILISTIGGAVGGIRRVKTRRRRHHAR